MKGFVYIICNKAMPGLCKIGYTLKEPSLRAKELAGTGNPYQYEVVYSAYVDEPRDLETQVHKYLNAYRSGKEWFKLDITSCIVAIKCHGKNIYKETFPEFTSQDKIEDQINLNLEINQCDFHILNLETQLKNTEIEMQNIQKNMQFDKNTMLDNKNKEFFHVIAFACAVLSVICFLDDSLENLPIIYIIATVIYLYNKNSHALKIEKEYIKSEEYKVLLKKINEIKEKIPEIEKRKRATEIQKHSITKKIEELRKAELIRQNEAFAPQKITQEKERIKQAERLKNEERLRFEEQIKIHEKQRQEEKLKYNENVKALEKRMREDRLHYEEKLRKLEKKNDLPPRDDVVGIYSCTSCNKKLRVPTGKHIHLTCPYCKNQETLWT